jgi:uncharacterized protein YecE (DUF72 family)
VDFGRLASIDAVRFDLPEIDPRSAELTRPPAGQRRPFVRIGAPAWSSRDFAKKLYPKGTKAGDNLARYAERLWAVELNATFHRVPDQRTVESWRDATSEDFRFCPKLHRNVVDRLDPDLARRFAQVVAHFGTRLGPMLLQLGPAFSPKRLPELASFLEALDGHAVAVELRHKSWFEARQLRADAFELFRARGTTTVVTDTAGRRDACHGSLTSRTAYVRFQGYDLHPTDTERLDAWAARIASWIERGVDDVYFFVHQPEDTLTPETLTLLADRVERACGLPAMPPPPVTTLFPV